MHELFVTINIGCDNFMLPVGGDRSVCMNRVTINMICGLQVGGKQCMHELCVTINIVVHSEICDNSVWIVGGDRSMCEPHNNKYDLCTPRGRKVMRA